MKGSRGSEGTRLTMGHEALQMLQPDGTLLGKCPMSRHQVRDALRLMLLSRAIDERLTKLQRMGRIALYGPVHGQEASVIGSAFALDPRRDWMVPASREQPGMLRHGLPLFNLFARYMGRIEDAAIPESVNLLPRQEAIGAQLPLAVGLAWSLKIRHFAGCVLVYFGDGASSEGDFHESCNLAALMHVPAVFVLINNQYAISTPVEKQAAAPLVLRALGYGFTGTAVDGNDIFAVFSACSAAVKRAVTGGGPSLVECRTYRIGFHNTSDNPKEYRDDSEVTAAMNRDPIDRFRTFAEKAGWWSAEDERHILGQIQLEIDQAQRAVEDLPRPGPEAIFDHVYAVPPSRLVLQRAETLAGAPATEASV